MTTQEVSIRSNVSGCGSGSCQCLSSSAAVLPSINGIPLMLPHELIDADTLRERAHAELLRQEAVRQSRLDDRLIRPGEQISDSECQTIERMVDEAVKVPDPSDEACRRYYESHKPHFVVGQAVHLRHILFAVTPGIDVHALSHHAETALLQLVRKDVAESEFEKFARDLSNCPSGADGGDLGWITPQDCAPELAKELFYQSDSLMGQGIHPRLVHTRFGFHIVDVLCRRMGKLQSYESVKERIAQQLSLASRAAGLRQYMAILVGQSELVGIELEGAASPLVQ